MSRESKRRTIAWPSAVFVCALWAVALVGCDDAASKAEDAITDLGGDVEALPVPCADGQQACWDAKLAVCVAGGSGWLVESCPTGELCIGGACLQAECAPGTLGCDEDAVVTCSADGLWSAPQACAAGQGCLEGACVPRQCTPGQRLCATDSVMVCQEDGVSWLAEFCDAGWVCFAQRCVQCVRDADCDAGGTCDDGACVPAPLAVVTKELPDGMVDDPYTASLQAEGGVSPYTWAKTAGTLPAGLTLSGAGSLSGTPTEAGVFPLTVALTDGDGDTVSAELDLVVHPQGLVIATDTLPVAEEGLEYSTRVVALGGTPPYAWGIGTGVLPLGLSLGSDGSITGIPSELGDFPLTFKVFDNTVPPAFASKELVLTVTIAPLEIIGDQELDLFLTKVITLPLIVVSDLFPVPYSTKLQARGGLRPYHWSEIQIPAGLSFLIPTGGIPDGLTLAADGTLSGAVTDPSQVITVSIPLVGFDLTGFFFMAEVADSQSPAEKKSALFLIPTVPIGGTP